MWLGKLIWHGWNVLFTDQAFSWIYSSFSPQSTSSIENALIRCQLNATGGDGLVIGRQSALHTSRLPQEGQHFADDNVKCTFWNDNLSFLIRLLFKCLPERLITSVSIGLGRGLAPNKWQVITWCINDDVVKCKYASQPLFWFVVIHSISTIVYIHREYLHSIKYLH